MYVWSVYLMCNFVLPALHIVINPLFRLNRGTGTLSKWTPCLTAAGKQGWVLNPGLDFVGVRAGAGSLGALPACPPSHNATSLVASSDLEGILSLGEKDWW